MPGLSLGELRRTSSASRVSPGSGRSSGRRASKATEQGRLTRRPRLQRATRADARCRSGTSPRALPGGSASRSAAAGSGGVLGAHATGAPGLDSPAEGDECPLERPRESLPGDRTRTVASCPPPAGRARASARNSASSSQIGNVAVADLGERGPARRCARGRPAGGRCQPSTHRSAPPPNTGRGSRRWLSRSTRPAMRPPPCGCASSRVMAKPRAGSGGSIPRKTRASGTAVTSDTPDAFVLAATATRSQPNGSAPVTAANRGRRVNRRPP